jgi:putative acyl-CoA dehydrogenase
MQGSDGRQITQQLDPRIKAPNQPPLLAGIDLFSTNIPLVEALDREGAGAWRERAEEIGTLAGDPEILELGFLANENPPVLKPFDRFGNRIDAVTYHPAYDRLMEIACGHGLHSIPWTEGTGGHAARAAMFMTWSQVEAGHGCPVSMTYAAVPALRRNSALSSEWEHLLMRNSYDPRRLPADEKRGALAGMAMTEKQGGSDVRANLTTATPQGGSEDPWLLDGHKWFCSAPMCDIFLTLAQTDEGPTCFAIPRMLGPEAPNSLRIQRLKDKLGNRSNASSEIEFHSTQAWLVGEPGRGIQTIIEMVNHTRLDCVLGSASGMRWALAQAAHHAAHRSAFGRLLAEQPMMQGVLADLALESEAATAVAMRLARAYDAPDDDVEEAAFRRIATAVAKYQVCKRQPGMVAEALEVLGGNGYVEESGMPRLYREAPLNGIWEGSGNVICLDVLRACSREQGTLDALLAEISLAADSVPEIAAIVDQSRSALADPASAEPQARTIVERLALGLQASLLVRNAPEFVAEAFVETRLRRTGGSNYGAIAPGLATSALVARATPSLD